MQQSRNCPAASVAILLVFATVIGTWSYLALWLGDDIYYRFFGEIPPAPNKLISSPWEIFPSMGNHYMTSNGRSVAHWLVQWFLVFGGRTLFSIANSAVYVVCAVYVMRLCGLKWNSHPKALLFVIAILTISFRTKFAPSCQIGYIWMMASTAVFIDLFLNIKDVKRTWIAPAATFCFLAGWGNEAVSAGVAVSVFAYIFVKKLRLTKTQWIIAVSYCVGALLLVAAPSNFNKIADPSIACSFPPLEIKLSVIYTAQFSRMLYLLAAVIVYYMAVRRVSLRDIYNDNAFYFNALATLLAFNFVITVYCNRQLFGAEFFALIIAVRLIARHGLGRNTRFIGAICLCAYAIAVCTYNYKVLIEQRSAYNYLERQYHESLDGTAFCDFRHRHSLFWAEEPNMDLGGNADVSMQKLWHSQGETKPFRILPACLKGKTNLRLKTQAVNMGNGSFMLISSRHKPAKRFVVHHYKKFGPIVRACDDGYSVPDHDAPDSNKAAYHIRCPHFIATIVSGDNFNKYVSGVDIEY